MKIKYLKRTQFFGDYQACRVIWITTLKGELLVKFTITDGEGKHLYTIMEPPESDTFDLSNNVLSLEHLEEIRDLLKANNPDIEWDITDEEEVIFMLGFFGECLARRHWLARDSKKDEDVIADYIFDASDKIVKGECFQTDYFKKEATEGEIIENYLLPKLLAREEVDTIVLNIARAGQVNSYSIVIQENE